MKAQQVNKLYNKLTPHEKAALAFTAAIRNDNYDFELILTSVEKRTYTTPHVDYLQRTQGLLSLAGVYSKCYWKTLFQLIALIGFYLDDDSHNKAAQRFINTLCSMDVALDVVCKELKIETSIIKQFAECSDYQPDFNGEPDKKLVEQYKEVFSKAAYLA